jgi:Tol biopolymer transport system component
MKKVQVTLLVLLALATAATIGCSGASSAKKPTLPTYTQLPFISNRTVSPATDLFLMNLDGSNVTPIPFSTTDVYYPSASADLSAIVFTSDDNIWVSNASGSTQTQLSNDNETWDTRVSPDGTKIFYSHENSSTDLEDVFVANIDGSSPVNLSSTLTSSSVYCYSGSFSADSSQVVFICWDENADFANIYTVNTDGTGLTPVLTQSSYCNDWCDTPAFSQDGTKIVFISYSVPESGTRPRQPAVSRPTPHGMRKRPSPKTPSTTYGIASMNVDGTGLTTFTPGAYELEVLNSQLYYTFYDSNSGTYQIYSANIDGSNAVALTDGTNEDYLGLEY